MESNSSAVEKLPEHSRGSTDNIPEVITDAENCKESTERQVDSSLENKQQYFEQQIEANNHKRALRNIENCKIVGEILQKPENFGCNLSDAEHECVCGFTVKQELRGTHNCVYDLRQVIEKQSSSLLGVQESLKKVRKYVRSLEKRMLDREAEYRKDIDEKLKTLFENLDDLIMRETRRCNGRCKKHVQTEKCLCRGFVTAAPHVCCGKQGGICDC